MLARPLIKGKTRGMFTWIRGCDYRIPSEKTTINCLKAMWSVEETLDFFLLGLPYLFLLAFVLC
jgi:predicted ABC-type sugar transport system permease subunit